MASFHVTTHDVMDRARMAPLENALARRGHAVMSTSAEVRLQVRLDELSAPIAASTSSAVSRWGYDVTADGMLPHVGPADVWLLGVPRAGRRLGAALVGRALAHPGRLLLFQCDDAEDMNWAAIPAEVLGHAHRVLRNHWPAGSLDGREHRGWLPPMMRPLRGVPGSRLDERPGECFFYGRCTNPSRSDVVRTLRSRGSGFVGGLVASGEFGAPPELRAEPLDRSAYSQALAQVKICLAPAGVHLVTFRFFEGLAHRCLVFAPSFDRAILLTGGLQAGVHYVELASDLSDLTSQLDYHLAHLDVAQAIADRGFEHYQRYLAPIGLHDLSAWMWNAVTTSWAL